MNKHTKTLTLSKEPINKNFNSKNASQNISNSPIETQFIAKNITKKWLNCGNHIFFLLEGPLGSGKTQFVKGIAKELKFNNKQIHSPTFVFITDFVKKKLILYHMDFYRIKKKIIPKILIDHLEEIQNYTKRKTITCIEWANKINKKIITQLSLENKGMLFIKIKISFFKKIYRKIVVTKL